MASFLNQPGTGEIRGIDDANQEVVRLISRGRCPTCGRRSLRALTSLLGPYFSALLTGAVIAIGVGYAPVGLGLHMRPRDAATLSVYAPLALFGLTALGTTLATLLRWQRTDSRIAWLAVDTTRAAKTEPQRAASATIALLSFSALMAIAVGLRHQTFAQAMTLFCEAPRPISPDETSANAVGAWLESRLTNEEARELLKGLPPEPEAAEVLLRQAVLRAELKRCPMLERQP